MSKKVTTDILIPSLERFIINALKDEDSYEEEYDNIQDCSSHKHNLVAKWLTGVDDCGAEDLAKELIKIFAYSSFCYDDESDDDGEENESGEFIKLARKVKNKLLELREMCCGVTENNKKRSNDDMSSKNGLVSRVLDTVAEDAKTVAIRIGAKQLAKTVREPMVAMLVQSLGLEDNSSSRAKVVGFLNSELGLGLVSLICSLGLKSLPIPGMSSEIGEELARELRLAGEMQLTEPVVDMVTAPLRYILTEQVLALPIPGLQKTAPQLSSQANSKPSPQVIEMQPENSSSVASKAVKAAKTVVTTAKKVVKKTKSPAKKATNNLEIKVKTKAAADSAVSN